jgi:hypothetical protein
MMVGFVLTNSDQHNDSHTEIHCLHGSLFDDSFFGMDTVGSSLHHSLYGEKQMIDVCDVVRFNNEYLRAGSCLAPGQRISKRKKGILGLGGKRYRGRQRLSVVVSLSKKTWDWRTKKWNQIAELDDGKVISVHWLRLVRKGTPELSIR